MFPQRRPAFYPTSQPTSPQGHKYSERNPSDIVPSTNARSINALRDQNSRANFALHNDLVQVMRLGTGRAFREFIKHTVGRMTYIDGETLKARSPLAEITGNSVQVGLGLVGGKLVEGTGFAADEVGKGVSWVGTEIEKLGKEIEPCQSTTTT